MAILVVHCGAHSDDALLDAAEAALAEGLGVLRAGGDALEAVIRAVVLLEDDERLNAGTGSRLNLAGEAEMDASLMDSRGEGGAVGAITGVRNPVLVAREVMRTPHLLLAGEGAVRFARHAGFPAYDVVTPRARRELERVRKRVRESPDPPRGGKVPRAGDTVGVVAVDSSGYMAAANSTGGIPVQLPGRIGDTPVMGAGIYVGPAAAVTATGVGEEILSRVLSKEVYDQIRAGTAPQRACEQGVGQFPAHTPIGLVAVSPSAVGVACNTRMAWRSGEA
ncbi:MAG: isoaspartyl peptidase/L-asparaginase [Thermoplasmata archaeon]